MRAYQQHSKIKIHFWQCHRTTPQAQSLRARGQKHFLIKLNICLLPQFFRTKRNHKKFTEKKHNLLISLKKGLAFLKTRSAYPDVSGNTKFSWYTFLIWSFTGTPPKLLIRSRKTQSFIKFPLFLGPIDCRNTVLQVLVCCGQSTGTHRYRRCFVFDCLKKENIEKSDYFLIILCYQYFF